MNFRTEITPEINPSPILHNEKILTLGSCFADNIAEKLLMYKFPVLSNPFGVLYNPVSIRNSIELLTGKRTFTSEDLFEYLGEWHSFYHHSIFSSEDKQQTLDKISRQIKTSSEFLRNTNAVIITFGTSFVYRHLTSGLIVSNCHKIPGSHFERIRLSPSEVEKEINIIISAVTEINAGARLIFTVSPIRHWKDGATENQLSKASLLLGISEIVKKHKNCRYFPSYEIVMDDLRDYRYYEADLLHPNQLAINYIWEKFLISEISRSADDAINEFGKLFSSRSHRPKDAKSGKFKIFAQTQLEILKSLKKKYPYTDLAEEEKYFSSAL